MFSNMTGTEQLFAFGCLMLTVLGLGVIIVAAYVAGNKHPNKKDEDNKPINY